MEEYTSASELKESYCKSIKSIQTPIDLQLDANYQVTSLYLTSCLSSGLLTHTECTNQIQKDLLFTHHQRIDLQMALSEMNDSIISNSAIQIQSSTILSAVEPIKDTHLGDASSLSGNRNPSDFMLKFDLLHTFLKAHPKYTLISFIFTCIMITRSLNGSKLDLKGYLRRSWVNLIKLVAMAVNIT